MNEQEKALTSRYALCQGSYWTASCAVNGFASVFLLARDFTSGQIGILMAVGNIIAVVLQPILAQKADRGGRLGLKNLTLLLGLIGLAAMVCLTLIPGSFLIVAGFFMIAMSAVMILQPLINAIGVYYMNRGGRLNYGVARAAGSLIYALLSMVLGVLVEKYSENTILWVGIIGYLILLLVVFSFRIKSGNPGEKKEAVSAHTGGYPEFFRKYRYFTLMLPGVICLFIFHFIANTYLIQIMTAVGGSSREMGLGTAIAAGLELPVMIFFSFLVGKFGAGRLLKISGIFFFVKALLTWLAPNVTGVYIAQAFQILSFAIYSPASVYYANHVMEEEDKVKGQALMTASYTIGAIIGNFVGGKLIDWSGVSAMLIFGTVCAAIGMIVLFLTIPKEKKEE